MISLNEISTLVQRIESIIGDSDHAVISVNVSPNITFVHLEAISFLTEFIEFEIEVDGDEDFPYDLKTKIGGVEFTTMMSAKGIVDLRESIPEQFDYIQRKLQVEANG